MAERYRFVKYEKKTYERGAPGKCIYCGKPLAYNFQWVCDDCEETRMKYKIGEKVWALIYNIRLKRVEIRQGEIRNTHMCVPKAYYVTSYTTTGSKSDCAVIEDYIFKTEEECIEASKKFTNMAKEDELSQYYMSQLTSVLSNELLKFFNNINTINAKITGLVVNVEDDKLNVTYQYGDRKMEKILSVVSKDEDINK